jgi:hypothetical protein
MLPHPKKISIRSSVAVMITSPRPTRFNAGIVASTSRLREAGVEHPLQVTRPLLDAG